MTTQPKWELIDNLGDASPIDYGGYFVWRDTTGVYTEEAEVLLSPDDDDSPEGWEVYRFSLDRPQIVTKDRKQYLVSGGYRSDWPHPVHRYVEWFADSLPDIAQTMDYPLDELTADLCSEDPIKRAEAYRAIGDYHGWANLDSYPLTFHDRAEVEARYADVLR